MEDFSSFVVEQEDAHVASVVGIPERIHVVEEAQVTDEDEVELVGGRGVTEGRRQGTSTS